ncbi:hypothetical protein F5972_36035 [Microbispora cellulosiformans]|uniref:Uncharacterized protein n=1 Tax=Microbispora cellulosiformans TaxID=2614688 RepID=A0A5J5JR04_9ACTN|nr:hypothetical protein [Microbispora cellulosiformans]KAA9373334.1 hypothetical protein F5972_36035 [Microbispora cellulosiformans]
MTTYHRVDLPGLIGDEPVGFLAAIGLQQQLMENSYLSWDPQDRHAIMHCRSYSSISDLVAHLTQRLTKIGKGEVIPYTSGFPVRRKPGAPDPLRIRSEEYRRLLERVSRRPGGVHWLKATVTDEAVDAQGFCLVNPLIAVRGRQTIGSFWYYPMLEVRQDPQRLLTEALTGWRRVEGSEGWLLDHRAIYSADAGLRGPGGSMAVPGATWLATLAVQKFGYDRRNGIDKGPPVPKGWFRVEGRDFFAWPLWSLPVNGNTLDAVWKVGWGSDGWKFSSISHGALQACIRRTHGVRAPNSVDHTVDLGIFTMCAAERLPRTPLTPICVDISLADARYGEYEPWKGWDWEAPHVGDYPGKYGWG